MFASGGPGPQNICFWTRKHGPEKLHRHRRCPSFTGKGDGMGVVGGVRTPKAPESPRPPRPSCPLRQDGPRTSQDLPKQPKTPQDSPRTSPGHPRPPPLVPADGSTTAPRRPKMPPRRSNTFLKRCPGHLGAVLGPQEAPRRQERPKSPPGPP